MAKQNRIYGLMVGATIGLAFWGCMGIGRGRAERDEAVFAASPAIVEPVSYTHLTLPTSLIV